LGSLSVAHRAEKSAIVAPCETKLLIKIAHSRVSGPAPRVSVDVSEWQVQRKDTGIDGSQRSEEISQIYHVSGLGGPNKTQSD